MLKRISLSLMVVVLIGSVLTAWRRRTGAGNLSQLPLFTGATESTNALLIGMLEGLRLQVKTDTTIKSTEGKAYDVPEGTFGTRLNPSTAPRWRRPAGQAKVTDSNLGYARGNQAVNVIYVEGVGLVVVLTEAK